MSASPCRRASSSPRTTGASRRRRRHPPRRSGSLTQCGMTWARPKRSGSSRTSATWSKPRQATSGAPSMVRARGTCLGRSMTPIPEVAGNVSAARFKSCRGSATAPPNDRCTGTSASCAQKAQTASSMAREADGASRWPAFRRMRSPSRAASRATRARRRAAVIEHCSSSTEPSLKTRVLTTASGAVDGSRPLCRASRPDMPWIAPPSRGEARRAGRKRPTVRSAPRAPASTCNWMSRRRTSCATTRSQAGFGQTSSRRSTSMTTTCSP